MQTLDELIVFFFLNQSVNFLMLQVSSQIQTFEIIP